MRKSNLTLLILASLLTTQHATGFEKGDVIVRVGAVNVSPDDSSSNVFAGGADLGVSLSVDDDTQLGLNFAYFLTDSINVEVLAATPVRYH
ncbi:MAG: outer membrane protein [Pseudohongiellaceae bacterium]|jgi:outer membrane protein